MAQALRWSSAGDDWSVSWQMSADWIAREKVRESWSTFGGILAVGTLMTTFFSLLVGLLSDTNRFPTVFGLDQDGFDAGDGFSWDDLGPLRSVQIRTEADFLTIVMRFSRQAMNLPLPNVDLSEQRRILQRLDGVARRTS